MSIHNGQQGIAGKLKVPDYALRFGGCSGARQVVRDRFYQVNTQWEGAVPHLYVDSIGLVTIGVGNMVDSPAGEVAGLQNFTNQLRGLPIRFKKGGGTPTWDQFVAEWKSIRAQRDKLSAVGAPKADEVTNIALTEEAMRQLVMKVFDSNDRFLMNLFGPEYCNWPADAQFACHSMIWALGQGGFKKFHQMIAALHDGDFARAATQCGIIRINDSVGKRSDTNASAFRTAALVVSGPPELGLKPSDLHLDITLNESYAQKAKKLEEERKSKTATAKSTIPAGPLGMKMEEETRKKSVAVVETETRKVKTLVGIMEVDERPKPLRAIVQEEKRP